MKKYFYAKGSDQVGPLTLEELKKADIQPNTLVWYEGLPGWEPAEGLEELREIFELMPPPLEAEALAYSEEPEKTFHDSLADMERKKQRMFANVFSTDGRIRRTEYGLTIIFAYAFLFLMSLIMQGGGGEFFAIIFVICYFPLIAVLITQGAKRCHDRGNSGWFQFIPFYGFWMLFAEGDPGRNKYGLNPKGR